jgi:radical SAM superfamily enzyme YgiQ (UPF0313 family)
MPKIAAQAVRRIGCGGSCTFCDLYHRKVSVRESADVFRQVDAMADLLGEEVDHFKRVVLLEGDALAVPVAELSAALRYAREKFDFSEEPFAHLFSKASTVCRKSPEDLRELRENGLLYVNMGLESGCQDLLDVVKPGQTLEMFSLAVEKLQAADISVSINIIAGMGGKEFDHRHTEETIAFLQTLPGQPNIYYSPLVVPEGAKYRRQEEIFLPLTPDEVDLQCRRFEEALGAALYLFIPI